jgi:hypothetical protein
VLQINAIELENIDEYVIRGSCLLNLFIEKKKKDVLRNTNALVGGKFHRWQSLSKIKVPIERSSQKEHTYEYDNPITYH